MERKVFMDMADNAHEKALGNGLKGSWQTKYHEEGHQIAHILKDADSITGGTQSTSILWEFTDPRTVTGSKMRDAIKEDLLGFVNQSIDIYNGTHKDSKPVKYLTSFDKVPREVRYAFDEYYRSLTANGMDRKTACQLGIVIDAIGLYTKDRLSRNTLSVTAWGHASSYNKDRGVTGSTCETWATFFSLRTCGAKDEVDVAKKFMPNTWNVMDGVFHNIADYVKVHPIGY